MTVEGASVGRKLRTMKHVRGGAPINSPWKLVATTLAISLAALTVGRLPLSRAAAESEARAAPVPTVIVRGFLNYRTTVDGTVLLFTPDAGGSSSAAAQPAPSSASLASSTQASLQVRPTQVTIEPAETRLVNGPALAEAAAPADQWRPVSPTPPLRQLQTIFRPGDSRPAQPALVVEAQASFRPSVQADDVTEPSGAAVAVSGSRARLPKRPQLGFTGQALRGGGSGSGPAKAGQEPGEPAGASHINGIRRPGLSAAASEQLQNRKALPPSAFQQRLTQASAKLRNRFKKPAPASSTGTPLVVSPPTEAAAAAAAREPKPDTGVLASTEEDLASSSSTTAASSPTVGSDEVLEPELALAVGGGRDKPEPRSGDQRPHEELPSVGGLQAGPQLLDPMSGLDSFFMGDDRPTPSSSAAAPGSSRARPAAANNERLNGWLDQHHTKFVPRPPKAAPGGAASQQLAASLNSLAPSFSVSLGAPAATSTVSLDSTAPANSTAAAPEEAASAANSSLAESLQMQTITRTYSTVMTSTKTRLVPMQVKSSTGVHTINEQYVITKMLTAYQTLPVQGEFILTDQLSTRAPFDMFNEPLASNELPSGSGAENHKLGAAPGQPSSPAAGLLQEPALLQELPVSPNQLLGVAGKHGNDWLHEFGAPANDLLLASNQLSSQQQHQLTSLANGLASSDADPLDQLASTLDPSALLAAGNIPDLNNPLVLAAAIQNPQLAAVILAAQQLQLKQQQQHQQQHHNHQSRLKPVLSQQMAPAAALQPSYSTSLSTTVRASTYTARDTMYTTRLVSFKDGRTVRTRTVSEPGSVVEQVLTTTLTELTPVTLTIRPTGALLGGPLPLPMTAAAAAGQAPPSAQATLSNALFATQLAQLLARRQQQVQQQPSLLSQAQQLLQAGAGARPQSSKQFQPNFQQLLASMQQQQQQQQQSQQVLAQPEVDGSATNPLASKSQADAAAVKPAPSQQPTPPLPPVATGPFVTTITSLQVRTYTVHNAFKTIFRTITSTQLLTSTVLPGALG